MCENCNCMALDKNNNKFLAINSANIIKIEDIDCISVEYDDLHISTDTNSFRISLNNILSEDSLFIDNVINFTSDIINNIYDDFASSNLYEILCRKLFIYLTIEMCEKYTIASLVNTFMYTDSSLESLITDCSTILCRIDFYKNEISEYTFYGKHHGNSPIKIDDLAVFEDYFNTWNVLREIVENFEVY